MRVGCSTTISASMSRRWGGICRVIRLALVVGSALTPTLNPVLWKGMTRLVSVPVAYLLGLRSSFGPQVILVGALELVQVRADRTRGTAGLSKKLRLKEGSQKMTCQGETPVQYAQGVCKEFGQDPGKGQGSNLSKLKKYAETHFTPSG